MLTLVVVALNAAFLAVVADKNEFSLAEPLVTLSFTLKILFDVGLVMAIVLLLKALFKTPWVAALFLSFNLLLSLANIILYYFGNTMVERHHFALIAPYSVTAFVPWWGLLTILAIEIVSVYLFKLLVAWIPPRALYRKILILLVIMGMLTAIGRAGFFVKKNDDRLDKVVMGFRNAQIYYACRNEFLSLIKDVTFPALGSKLKALSPSTESFVDDYVLIADDFKIESDPSKYQTTIDQWHLPLTESAPALLDLKPFTRIIYILAESISLEALPCHNDAIKADYADKFFCSTDIKERTFSNLYTTGSPTLQGLTVIYSGHPNFTLPESTGHPNSLPKILQKNGWKSVFIRSASKYFANENMVFKSMGFSEVIGREDFYEDKNLRKYIYGWGLEDRKLYEKAIEYIEKNRDRKLFVSIFGTDTHPPHGQEFFKHLKYPARPNLRKNAPKDTYKWLHSIDNMDYDIAEFIENLEEKGLLDENTLVIVSADHSCPVNNVSKAIPGHPKNNLGLMPLVFLSGQSLPQTDYGQLASEIDIAPTIIHLLGLPKVKGWWGDSLFNKNRKFKAVGFDQNFIRFQDADRQLMINVEKPANDLEKAFIELFNMVFIDKATSEN